MDAVKQVYLLLICQGFYLGSVGQSWTFPSTVSALTGSCVEIPCTYDPAGTSRGYSTVWYLYDGRSYPEILNTKDSSSVLEEYRGRTSLVPGQSCALRIDPVREGDKGSYYPGIAEDKDRNAYKKQKKTLSLHISDKVVIQLHGPKRMTEGKATMFECAVPHTCPSRPPSLQWNKPGQVINRSVGLFGLFHVEESNLTFIPSYVDDGSPVQCTATYPNGQNAMRTAELKILFAPKHVTVSIIEKGEILEGSDVNLMCISISKPEVIMYEWYKGQNRTLLPYTRWKMTVHNVTRDMEPYSCAAINTVGKGESALMELPVLYGGSSYYFTESNSNVILLATIGTVVPLLLLLIVYLYWRKRCRKVTSSEAAESPDATYSDLVKKDIGKEYEELRPVNSKHIVMRGHVGADNQHENTQKKNGKTVQSFT